MRRLLGRTTHLPAGAGGISRYIDSEPGREERAARLRRLRLFGRYYRGDVYAHPAEWAALNGYAASVFPPEVYLNYARFLIDRLASFSFDRVVGVSLSADGQAACLQSPSAGERFLTSFVRQTGLLRRLTPIAREALLFGDVLLRLLHTEKAEMPLAWSMIPAEEFDYEHDPRDLSQVLLVRDEFFYYDEAGARKVHREEYYPDRIVYYRDEIASQPVRGGRVPTWLRSGGFDTRLLEVERELPNPFGFIPAVHVRNRPCPGEKYGTSELADLTCMLDDLNWKVAQRSRTISRTMNAVLKNVNGRIVSDQLDDTQIISVVGENAQLEYLVNNSDLAPVQQHLSELKQALSDLTGVVMLSPDKLTSVGAMSGFALSILYEPLLNAARTKRREIGGKIEEFLKLVLAGAAELKVIPRDEATVAEPRLLYEPDLQFTEQEKLIRLRRELLAAERGVAAASES